MDNVLNAAEMAALLGVGNDEEEYLTNEEKDALGEVGNICMGAAATSLSILLNQQVSITSPEVRVRSKDDFLSSFTVPLVAVQVVFSEGLDGSTLLIIKASDAAVIADLMMGNDGSAPSPELGEMEISAAAEAMNQMVGASATSLSSMVKRPINIEPPNAVHVDGELSLKDINFDLDDPMVIVFFQMTVGEVVNTQIMQIMPLNTARLEASLLLSSVSGDDAGEPLLQEAKEWDVTEGQPQPAPAAGAQPVGLLEGLPEPISDEKLQLFMDIPLKLSVILGRTRRPISEVLSLVPGSIVELSSLADEAVDIMINGTVVARGEVVVVNENFGVRITSILSPQERMKQLR